MRTIDAGTLKELLLGGTFWVIENKEELNKINKFPVADADTGTNLSATLYAVYRKLKEKDFSSAGHLLKEVAMEAFSNARGNSGVIISQYLSALSNYIKKEYVDIKEFATSLRKAYYEVHSSLENPVEGTILTVMREVGEEAEIAEKNGLSSFLSRIVERAKISLEKTREILPVLKREGVVDSGAKGFFLFLEGMKLAFEKRLNFQKITFDSDYPAEARGDGLFCTIITLKTKQSHRQLTSLISHLGDSIIITSFNELTKVHIHTDEPETAKKLLMEHGEIINSRYELIIEEEEVKRDVGILVDSALDIPKELAREWGIEIIPVGVVVEGKALKDQDEISRDIVAKKLEEKAEITSSLPLPSDFIRYYSRLKRKHRKIIAFHLSSTVSGTYSLSRSVASKLKIEGEVIDTGNFSLGGGLKVLRAVELLDKGIPLEEVMDRIKSMKTHAFVYADDLSYAVKGGRVKPWKGILQRYLKLGIIMGFSPEKGGLHFKGAAPGSRLALKLLERKIKKELNPDAIYDIGLVFTREDERIKEIEGFLQKNIRIRKLIKTITSPAIMIHAGPSAFGVFVLKIS